MGRSADRWQRVREVGYSADRRWRVRPRRHADHHCAAGPKASGRKTASKFPDWLIAFGDSGYAVLYQVDGEQSIVLADRH